MPVALQQYTIRKIKNKYVSKLLESLPLRRWKIAVQEIRSKILELEINISFLVTKICISEYLINK